jgi:hypothetical protein
MLVTATPATVASTLAQFDAKKVKIGNQTYFFGCSRWRRHWYDRKQGS